MDESHIIEITPELERRVSAERRKGTRDQLAAKDREINDLKREIANLQDKIIEQSEAMAEMHYIMAHGHLPPTAGMA